MKYKKHFIAFFMFSILFFLTSNLVICQKKLEKVTIEFLDGSTKKGLLLFKSPLDDFSQLKYHKSKKSPVEKIDCEVVKSFTVKNYTYHAHIVSVENSSDQKNKLDADKTPKMRTDYALILPIIQGQKSLYYYKDADQKEHFFITEGEELVTLIYKKYADYFGSVIRMRENRTYIGQLSQYLQTDGWLVDFTSFTYDVEKLKELFLFYYRVNAKVPEFIFE